MKAVNLLPSDQRSPAKASGAVKAPAAKGGAFGAYAVLGALAFGVIALAAYVLTTNTIKDREAELARVSAEATALNSKAAALQPYADFKNLATQRVTTVQGLAGSRFEWERTLRDLSRALPRDVHLRSFKGSTSAATSGGGGSLRGAIQAPAIELSGCTTSQSGVARLMARLRAVRGVTRVSLSKSDKDGSGASVAGSTGGSLCARRGAPSFDLVVFFERAAVATGAQPNQPAPSGAAPHSSTPNSATPPNAGSGGAPAPGTAGTQSPQSGTATNPPPTTSGTQSGPSTQGVSAP